MEDQILLVGQGIIAVLTGFLVEALKRAGLPTKYAMLTSALLGLLLGILMAYLTVEVTLVSGIFGGILAGAVASGVYSGGKMLIKKEEEVG